MSLKLNDVEIKKKIRRDHFLEAGAIYRRTKEEVSFTWVRRACDNYTMACVCFSWALPFSRSPLTLKGGGGGRGQGPAGNYAVSRTVKSDTFLGVGEEGRDSTKSRGRL